MTYYLLYFCMACVVLYFRRLCSKPPEIASNDFAAERWWFQTLALMLAWPVLAPLAGSYQLGRATRTKIEKHNARIEENT